MFQGFYEEVSSPLLLEVDMRYPDNAVDYLTKNHFSQLFDGSEIVVSGRVTDNHPKNFVVAVFAKGVRHGHRFVNLNMKKILSSHPSEKTLKCLFSYETFPVTEY